MLETHDERLKIEMPPAAKGGKVPVMVKQPWPGNSELLSSNKLDFEYWPPDSKKQPVKFDITYTDVEDNPVRIKYCFGHVFMTTHLRDSAFFV